MQRSHSFSVQTGMIASVVTDVVTPHIKHYCQHVTCLFCDVNARVMISVNIFSHKTDDQKLHLMAFHMIYRRSFNEVWSTCAHCTMYGEPHAFLNITLWNVRYCSQFYFHHDSFFSRSLFFILYSCSLFSVFVMCAS